jgi:hypothetical protein
MAGESHPFGTLTLPAPYLRPRPTRNPGKGRGLRAHRPQGDADDHAPATGQHRRMGRASGAERPRVDGRTSPLADPMRPVWSAGAPDALAPGPPPRPAGAPGTDVGAEQLAGGAPALLDLGRRHPRQPPTWATPTTSGRDLSTVAGMVMGNCVELRSWLRSVRTGMSPRAIASAVGRFLGGTRRTARSVQHISPRDVRSRMSHDRSTR